MVAAAALVPLLAALVPLVVALVPVLDELVAAAGSEAFTGCGVSLRLREKGDPLVLRSGLALVVVGGMTVPGKLAVAAAVPATGRMSMVRFAGAVVAAVAAGANVSRTGAEVPVEAEAARSAGVRVASSPPVAAIPIPKTVADMIISMTSVPTQPQPRFALIVVEGMIVIGGVTHVNGWP